MWVMTYELNFFKETAGQDFSGIDSSNNECVTITGLNWRLEGRLILVDLEMLIVHKCRQFLESRTADRTVTNVNDKIIFCQDILK